MYAGLGGGASEEVLRRMENDASNLGLAVSSLELLHDLTAVSAVDFDNVASLGCRSNQRAVWVHRHSSNLGVVSWDHQIDGLVNHYKTGSK